MGSYAVFVALAVLTIALPGPGVLMTINNAARRGFHRATAGIFGISLGVLMVAALSATGLGVLLAKSATAFMVMKYIGALYLIYLGVKVWRAKDAPHLDSLASEASAFRCFFEGVLLSLSNLKSIVFFMSVFPQFINPSEEYLPQFVALASTFSALIIAVHTAYASLAILAKSKLFEQKGCWLMKKVSGGLLVSFGVGLATSKNPV